MSAIERLTVTVPADMAASVRDAVAGGDYASTSDVVREALRDWSRHRDEERQDQAALREALRAGFASGPSLSAEDVFAELRARYADRA